MMLQADSSSAFFYKCHIFFLENDVWISWLIISKLKLLKKDHLCCKVYHE